MRSASLAARAVGIFAIVAVLGLARTACAQSSQGGDDSGYGERQDGGQDAASQDSNDRDDGQQAGQASENAGGDTDQEQDSGSGASDSGDSDDR